MTACLTLNLIEPVTNKPHHLLDLAELHRLAPNDATRCLESHFMIQSTRTQTSANDDIHTVEI